MANINDTIQEKGNVIHGDSITTMFGKFHKDFNRQMDEANLFLGLQNEELIATRKRLRLQQAALKGIIGKPTVTASNRKDSVVGKSIVNTVKTGDKNTVSKLEEIFQRMEKDAKAAEKAKKESAKISRKAIIQANLIQTVVAKMKEFFIGGDDIGFRTINAIENVERAVLGQEREKFDDRTQFRQFLDSYEKTGGDVLGGLADAFSVEIEQIMGAMGDVKRTGEFGKSEASKIFSNIPKEAQPFIDKIMGSFGTGFDNIKSMKDQMFTGDISQESKKKTDKTASSIFDYFDGAMDSIFKSNMSKNNSLFLSAVGLFGETADIGLATFLTAPLKTMGASFKIFKKTLSTFIDRPINQSASLISSQFGAQVGLLSSVPLLFGKILKNTLFISPTELFGKMKKKMKSEQEEVSVFSAKFAKERLFTLKFWDSQFSKTFTKIMNPKNLLMPFKIFGKGIDMMKHPVDTLTSGISAAGTRLKKTSNFFKKHLFDLDTSPFKKTAKLRADIADKGAKAMDKTTTALSALVASLATFKNSIIFGFVLKKVTTQFGKFKTFMGRAGDSVKATTMNLLESSSIFQQLRRRFEFLNPMVEKLNDRLKGTFGFVKNLAVKGITMVRGFISGIIEQVQEKRGKGNKLKSKAGAGLGSIIAMVDAFTPKFVKTFASKIVGIFGTVGKIIMGGVMLLGKGLVAALFSVPALIVGALVGIGYLMYKNWDTVTEKWKSWIVEPFNSFLEWGSEKFGMFAAGVRSFFDPIFQFGESVNTFVQLTTGVDLAGTISNLFTTTVESLKAGIGLLVSPFSYLGEIVTSSISGLWSTIKGAATEYLPSWLTAKFLSDDKPASPTKSLAAKATETPKATSVGVDKTVVVNATTMDKKREINSTSTDVTKVVNTSNKVDRLVTEKKEVEKPVITEEQMKFLAAKIAQAMSRPAGNPIVQAPQDPDALTKLAVEM